MDAPLVVTLTREERYRFDVRFEGKPFPSLRVDEATPPGDGTAPNPEAMLAAAVGQCLSSSLLFCLERSHVGAGRVKTSVRPTVARNEKGRWRVEGIDVRIDLALDDPADGPRLERCREIFEDFCVVTESVRRGVPVRVAFGEVP